MQLKNIIFNIRRVNRLKRVLYRIPYLLDKIVLGIFKLIDWFTLAKTIVVSILFIFIGQIINFYQPFENFHIYQFLVIPSIILATWAVKRFISEIKVFNQMIASYPTKFVGMKMTKLIFSKWLLPGLLLIGGLYIYAAISLKYIELNLIGFYAFLMIIMMLTSAILGQTIYAYYIILLIRMNKEKDHKYNFYIPAKTNWVVKLAKTGRMLNNSFFVLGFIYTLVYYLNVPAGSIKIIENTTNDSMWGRFELSTPDNLIFIISWLMILVIIIIAFPVYYYFQTSYTKTLVQSLKDESIFKIQRHMKAKDLTESDLEVELKYLTLINNVESSPSKPLSSYNVIPILSSVGSISIHFIKISESIL